MVALPREPAESLIATFRDGVRDACRWDRHFLPAWRTGDVAKWLLRCLVVLGGLFTALAALVAGPYNAFVVGVARWMTGMQEPTTRFSRLIFLCGKLGWMATGFLPWMMALYQVAGYFCGKIAAELARPGSTRQPAPPKGPPSAPLGVLALMDVVVQGVVDFLPVAFFLAEVGVAGLVPYVGLVFGIFARSAYYSYITWSYKWIATGALGEKPSIAKRMRIIERNWPYFVGFGLPMSLLTWAVPSLGGFLSPWVYAVASPFFVLTAFPARITATNIRPSRPSTTAFSRVIGSAVTALDGAAPPPADVAASAGPEVWPVGSVFHGPLALAGAVEGVHKRWRQSYMASGREIHDVAHDKAQ